MPYSHVHAESSASQWCVCVCVCSEASRERRSGARRRSLRQSDPQSDSRCEVKCVPKLMMLPRTPSHPSCCCTALFRLHGKNLHLSLFSLVSFFKKVKKKNNFIAGGSFQHVLNRNQQGLWAYKQCPFPFFILSILINARKCPEEAPIACGINL